MIELNDRERDEISLTKLMSDYLELRFLISKIRQIDSEYLIDEYRSIFVHMQTNLMTEKQILSNNYFHRNANELTIGVDGCTSRNAEIFFKSKSIRLTRIADIVKNK